MGKDLSVGNKIKWVCQCCGVQQDGVPMSFGYKQPHNWSFLTSTEHSRSHLDADICIINHDRDQTEYQIRCVMPFLVPEIRDNFDFGVWISVSEKSMKIYKAGNAAGSFEKPDCFGYLLHSLPGYQETWALEGTLVFSTGNLRPYFYLNKTDHQLYQDQKRGLPLDYIKSLVVH